MISLDINNQIQYTGVDSAQELITLAQQHHSSQQFIHQDMISYLESLPAQSINIAISLASFQHLANRKERLYALKLLYQALKYDGIHISINRSRSNRMIRKHRSTIAKSIAQTMITAGHHSFNDLHIPRTQHEQTSYRYYHIFGLSEIKRLHTMA
jgi:trans-aconitate methyltransferase